MLPPFDFELGIENSVHGKSPVVCLVSDGRDGGVPI
jgi:hypothetical protein